MLLTSLTTLATNLLFALACEPLIRFICSNSLRVQQLQVNIALFCLLLANSCFIPLMARSNFTENGENSILAYLFDKGRNNDFGAKWYSDFGPQLALNLFFLALLPVVNYLLRVGFVNLRRRIKLKYFYNRHTNNQSDNIKFFEIYTGPDYNFATKSASLNVVLFCTLTFGFGLPILYPIAIFAILVQYVTQRYVIAIFYRLPQNFQTDITFQNLMILSAAPFVWLGISFWMVGNKQLFGSLLNDKPSLYATPDSNHSVAERMIALMTF